jgi:hypothetical protein
LLNHFIQTNTTEINNKKRSIAVNNACNKLQILMPLDYLIKGIIIGFSIAAPVGPIGVLTIKRTLAEGRLSGFVTGMGAAMADAVYRFIAGFGLLIKFCTFDT